ncbi:hypothetical protein FFF34_005380 [Inquilinus sp. KBS0705]|nr:hypothetical protein FFF34_005380 [Inquilinus sp. KBS0705]
MATEKDYLKAKSEKKKSASAVAWMLVAVVVLFAVFLAKFALTGSASVFSGMPDSDQAYTIAKEFITPTVLSGNIKYSDSEYKFAKKSDSVYVIKSQYSSQDNNGESSKTNFTITLKYNGGAAGKTQNWTMLDLNQDN